MGTLDMDLAASILSHCSIADLSVSKLLRAVGGSHDKALAVIRELQKRRLLKREARAKQRVGRPGEYLRPTPIGIQFVRDYRRLQHLSLHINDNDIRRALHQAELAEKLADKGISPYERFQEINELAGNIASTAKAKRHTR
jgi:predicted transcriptional regulator